MEKFTHPQTNNFESSEKKERSRGKKALTYAAIFGVGFGLGTGYSSASERTPLESTTEMVMPGDNNFDPVHRAIHELQEDYPDFDPSTETIYRTSGELGTIHPADEIEVTAIEGSKIDHSFVGDGDQLEVTFVEDE